jgi:MFS family permease
MVVAFMQVLDTSVTNVALPHMQGSLSAGVEEVAWVITSYLAANAVIIPGTGWLTADFGRRKFFLVCTVLFTVLVPFMRRVHTAPPPGARPGERVEGLRAPGEAPHGVVAVE